MHTSSYLYKVKHLEKEYRIVVPVNVLLMLKGAVQHLYFAVYHYKELTAPSETTE